MNDITNPVALATQDETPGMAPAAMPIALALYLDDKLYERASHVASRMSKADGMTPKHLIGKPEACFAVVGRALTWRLDPFAVGMCTYQTPGGDIGFEGKLIHAIIENSGRLAGPVRYDHYGDWSKVQGRFKMVESPKGGSYAKPTWTDDDARAGKPTDTAKYPHAQSCGVRVSATLRGESTPRTLDFDLVQAQPRNSTLWATDPMTQICYTAIRRFGSVAVPALIMGVPFDATDTLPATGQTIDVTPAPAGAIDDLNAEIASKAMKGAAAGAPAQALAPAPQGGTQTFEGMAAPTFAEVMDQIHGAEKSKSVDDLALARDLIRHVQSEQQRAELDVEAKRAAKVIADVAQA